MRLKIDVTKSAIRTGERGCSTSCAIARALGVSLRKKKVHFSEVDVGCGGAGVIVRRKDADYLCGTLPLAAEVFVSKFDDPGIPRSKLKPFSFSLDLL